MVILLVELIKDTEAKRNKLRDQIDKVNKETSKKLQKLTRKECELDQKVWMLKEELAKVDQSSKKETSDGEN